MRLLASYLSLSLLAAGPLAAQEPPDPAQEPELRLAPLNPAFLAGRERARNSRPDAAGLRDLAADPAAPSRRLAGHIPPPFAFPKVAPALRATAPEDALPAAWDLRERKGVRAIRDQGFFGTCWAHAALASLESGCLLNAGPDLSLAPYHLAWFNYHDQDAERVAFTLQGPDAEDCLDWGGNSDMATAMLLRGTGAVAEAACPYPTTYPLRGHPTGLEPRVVHVREAIRFPEDPSPGRDALLKRAIMEKGALDIAIYWYDGGYSPDTAAYRDQSGYANHAVAIVGWDDAWPASNFPEGNRPSRDGAWLVRNSWGTGWGEQGYFHLSYDSTFLEPGVFIGEGRQPSHIYQHDPLGLVGTTNPGRRTDTAAWMASVFTALADESLEAVSFPAVVPGTTYEISIYSGVTDQPDGGSRILEPQQGRLDQAGYRCVALAHPVAIHAGDRFSVVVYLTTPGFTHPIPIQYAQPSYSEKSRSRPGECFVRAKGGQAWSDVEDLSGGEGKALGVRCCLKVLAYPLEP